MAWLNQLWMGCSGTVHVVETIDKTMRARFVSIMICVFALAFPALGENRRGGPSLDRVLPHIRQSVPGTFYDAEGPFLSPDGQTTYQIKWMTPDGRIIWFAVDARNGQIVGAAPLRAPDRYRRDEDNRGWPRSNFRDGDADNRYQDRGWNRDGARDGNRGWGGNDGSRRDGDWGRNSGSGRYDRGPERSHSRGPERGHDRGRPHSNR